MDNKIPHNCPTVDQLEVDAVSKVIQSNQLTQGSQVEAFEKEFCQVIGFPSGHAVAVSSGSAALFLALNALNIRGRNVALPSYVCSSVKHAINLAGGFESFIDNQHGYVNMDPKVCAGLINTDVVVFPYLFGLLTDVRELAGKKIVIEDCCQALGGKIGDTSVGMLGEVGVFSFYTTKLMTSGGQGGMVVSKRKEWIDQIRDFVHFDLKKSERQRFNFLMTDMQAAFARVQLKKLPQFLKRREEIYSYYKTEGLDLIDSPKNEISCRPVRFRAVLRTSKSQEMKSKLEKAGISSIVPIEDWELLAPPEICPNAYQLTKNTVSIPLYPKLTDREVETIVREVKNLGH